MFLKLINKIGFFKLMLIPLGLTIIVSAVNNNIFGMGIVGFIVLLFGFFNKCLLLGNCDTKTSIFKKNKKTRN